MPRLISNEMVRRYDNHNISDSMRRNILNRTGDITRFDYELVARVVQQVEAQYVFSILKSTLSSQRSDPFVKNMLNNFHIDPQTPALQIEMLPVMHKMDLHPGILEFKFSAILNELSGGSISVSNAKYMQLPKLLGEITADSIFKFKNDIFIVPIPAEVVQLHGPAKFGKSRLHQIEAMCNKYPLEHRDWIEAQKVIQVQFQRLLKETWAEKIASQIWSFIGDDFTCDTNMKFDETQVDPSLLKVFN